MRLTLFQENARKSIIWARGGCIQDTHVLSIPRFAHSGEWEGYHIDRIQLQFTLKVEANQGSKACPCIGASALNIPPGKDEGSPIPLGVALQFTALLSPVHHL